MTFGDQCLIARRPAVNERSCFFSALCLYELINDGCALKGAGGICEGYCVTLLQSPDEFHFTASVPEPASLCY